MAKAFRKRLLSALCILGLSCGMLSGAGGVKSRALRVSPTMPPTPAAASPAPTPAPTPLRTAAPVPASAPEAVPEQVGDKSSIPCVFNGEPALRAVLFGDVPYLCALDFFTALGITAAFSEDADGALRVEAEGLSLTAAEGELYFICNDRALYAPEGVRRIVGSVFLPAAELARCTGAAWSLDETRWTLDFSWQTLTPLENGADFYDADDLYWLSRVIYAESGNQSLRGQLAVGNVVLNRLHSEVFDGQDTVEEVIFAQSQFEVVDRGSIYMTPGERSVTAAKLALEGYSVVPDALFFATFQFGSRYVCVEWIGDHCFMTLA